MGECSIQPVAKGARAQNSLLIEFPQDGYYLSARSCSLRLGQGPSSKHTARVTAEVEQDRWDKVMVALRGQSSACFFHFPRGREGTHFLGWQEATLPKVGPQFPPENQYMPQEARLGTLTQREAGAGQGGLAGQQQGARASLTPGARRALRHRTSQAWLQRRMGEENKPQTSPP